MIFNDMVDSVIVLNDEHCGGKEENDQKQKRKTNRQLVRRNFNVTCQSHTKEEV